MGNGADSVKAYSAVLHKKPNDAEALAALEALLKDDAVRAEAARALIPAYEAVKEHRKLVAALDLVAEMTQDQLERVLALQQAAHVHLHHLRQPELAFAALSRALRLSPADPNLRTSARRAAEDSDAMDGFATVLKELVSRGDLESSARVALHRDLADVQEKKLDDRRGAVAQLESVLVIDPGNVDALRGRRWRRAARVGERQPARRSLHQPHAQPLLELLDAPAHRVGRPAQPQPGLRKAAVPDGQLRKSASGSVLTCPNYISAGPLRLERFAQRGLQPLRAHARVKAVNRSELASSGIRSDRSKSGA